MVKTYLKTWYPGSFVSEDSVKEVAKREDNPELGERAYGWQYFDREYVMKDGEELLGPAKNHSPTFYLGEELSAKQAIAQGNSILKFNVEANGYKRMVRTKFGQMFPIGDNDIVKRP